MGREKCQMCTSITGKIYCDYYDFMYNECREVADCLEGLDNEQYDDEYIEYDDLILNDEDEE